MRKYWLKNLKREKTLNFNRSNFLRLDKNERVINFDKIFLSTLKKKLSSFEISSYPNIGRINQLLSKSLKVASKNICLTSGSDFGLRMCFEYFCKEGDNIITLNPTFGMVEVYSKLFGLKNIKINYDKKLNIDSELFFKSLKKFSKSISLVVLANPNSPTGTIIDHHLLKKIIAETNKREIPIVIDEAYYGFYKFTCINYLKRYKNLIILRTFSKASGLAGLRAGYIITGEKISKNLFKYRPMYEINSISCLAIEQVIKNKSISKFHISQVNKSKKYLINELTKMKYNYLNTHGNFFHIDLKKNKLKFEKILKKNKILTRKGPGVKGFENYLRFSLGSVSQMKKVIQLLKSL